MRTLVLTILFALPVFAQNQNFDVKKVPPPDADTLAKIKARTEELGKAIDALPKNNNPFDQSLFQVKIFHKAAVWIVRQEEWFNANSGKQTLDVLDAGLARAKALSERKTPWLEARNKPIALAYRSGIDDSVQPFSLRYPENFDPKKKYRLDVVLHGRNGSLTEVSFLHGKEFAKPGKGTDYFVLEVYGRGNNAYRWAGETDVLEALAAGKAIAGQSIDDKQIVLRGFSMGGAGTWHIGLHHPDLFAVMSPGAGFSDTKTYIKGFPKQPDYIDKCLHIYDAVDYAENAFNIPIVAYSGGKDPQKAAADNIENILKKFKEPHSFSHIVAPDLEHKQPPEWWAKVDEQIRKELEKTRRSRAEHIRLVTYSLQTAGIHWARIDQMEESYKRALLECIETKEGWKIKTENVVRLSIYAPLNDPRKQWSIEIDGEKFLQTTAGAIHHLSDTTPWIMLNKTAGKWEPNSSIPPQQVLKKPGQCGPIDAAFMSKFEVIGPSGQPWHSDASQFVEARKLEFFRLWNKYNRAELVEKQKSREIDEPKLKLRRTHLVLFGDPSSNPDIARLLPKLPIQWTKDVLIMNGKSYDAKTHIPILIYPDTKDNYVVINSGHTFREDALKGTNALLYPRLGDWAVVKPKPTKDDPAAYEVIDAGIFDENWQFKK